LGILDFLKKRPGPELRHLEIAKSADFEAAELARDSLTGEQANELLELYPELSDWAQKDTVIHMLQDRFEPHMQTVFEDALNSPSPETVAVSLCLMHPDQVAFEDFLEGGFVSKSLVQEALRKVQI
jgi:hypothetical protein